MASETRQHYLAYDDDAAEPPSWDEVDRRRRVRVLIVAVIVVVAAIAAGIAVMVANAASHYERGREAMASRHFGVAAEEFTAARILTFTYRDAAALAKKAQQELEVDAAKADVQRQQRAAVSGLLRTASDRLDAGDGAGVIAALREARILVPEGTPAATSGQIAMATRLASALTVAGRGALHSAHWDLARSYATALLLLDPADATGKQLSQRSVKGADLQGDLDAARSAARQGHWRDALRLARGVLQRWPGFPGAAAVVAAAHTALKPKPKPKPTHSATPAPAPVVTVAPRPTYVPRPTAAPTPPPP